MSNVTLRNCSPSEHAFKKKFIEATITKANWEEIELLKEDVELYLKMIATPDETGEIQSIVKRKYGKKIITVTTLKARDVPSSWARYLDANQTKIQ
jgi:hypothetical protein